MSAEDREWEEFVRNAREHSIKQIEASAMVMSLVPDDDFDVKFALELGAAIMLDKPLIVIVVPGRRVSEHLRRVADEVVEVDIDTEDGQERLQAALRRLGVAS